MSPAVEPMSSGAAQAHRLILSQAIVGEIFAIENYARMIPLAETNAEKIALLDEAMHERAHVRVLVGVAKLLELPPVDSSASTDPYWGRVRAAMSELAERADLHGLRFSQDVVLEAYAVTLYGAVIPRVEPMVRRKLEPIAHDEAQHLDCGAHAFAELVGREPERAMSIVEFAHARVARVLAEWVAPSPCNPVCGVCGALGGGCNKPVLERLHLDTNRLAADFANVYGRALRAAGLAPAVAIRYVADIVSP